jgi:hypothetical protein
MIMDLSLAFILEDASVTGNFAGDIVSTEDTAHCAEDGLAAWTECNDERKAHACRNGERDVRTRSP